MSSTYSTLKFELIGTGDQAGTWGSTTNTNIGTAVEQAIAGKATCVTADFTSNVATYTLIDSNVAQTARAYILDITATLTGAGTINLPAISKPYIVLNNSVGGFAVTVKVSGQTGVSVPNGKRIMLYNNGTDVGVAVDYLPSLSLGTALPISSGGTGATTAIAARTNLSAAQSGANSDITSLSGLTTALSVAQGGTGVTNSTGTGSVVLSNSPTLVTPVLGTPASATLTNATGLPVSTGISGLGAGIASFLATPSSANLAAAVTDETGSGALVFANSPTFVTPALGTPASGTLTNCTFPTLNQNTTGTAAGLSSTLVVSSGGTGQTSYTDGQLLIGNTSGNTLTKATLTAGSGVTITNGNGSITIAATGTGGTVTSVGLTAPTGLTVGGSPVTGSGTLALTFTSGYSIPTTTSQSNWDTAYTERQQWDGGSTNLVASTGRTSLGATTLGSNLFTISNPGAVTFPRFNADNTVSSLSASAFRTAIGAGTGDGTVTSVTGTAPVASSGGTTPAISLNAGYGDTLNPYASKTANYFLAAPNGSSGVPSFRAIVAADIPTLNQNTTGYAAGLAGGAANRIAYQTGSNATSFITAPVTSSTFLQWDGSAFAWVSVGSAAAATSTTLGTVYGRTTTTAAGGVSLGYNALPVTTGSSNTAIGTSSLGSTTINTEYNTALGTYAGQLLAFGNNNVFVGLGAGYGLTNGNGNTYVGESSGPQASQASDISTNTGIGKNTLGALTTGDSNVALGYLAGNGITTGSNNVIIGGYTGSASPISATGSSYIVLSNGAGTVQAYADSSGNWTFTGTVTANSDERIKTNWRDLRPTFIEELSKVKVGIYDRIDTGDTQVGASAQSLKTVLEQAVLADSEGKLSVAYGNAALVAAVKLAEKVVELEARLAALESK